MWYLWLGKGSPLFAKSKMATFEIYLIADKAARKEVKNPFYTYLDDEAVMGGIFEDFGLDPETSRIVCGHVPVKVKDGEDPVKCGGRVISIDGGFSRAYQPTTGIAGYTLISNSYGFVLAAHEPLESARAAVVNELDIYSSRRVVERVGRRTMVADTDTGVVLKSQIADLEKLLRAYRRGEIAERPQ
jgi:fructose-1,6-bisphosphatase-3